MNFADIEDPQDDQDLKIRARRLSAYSTDALAKALPIDKLIVSDDEFKTALAAMDRSFQLSKEIGVPMGVRIYGPPGCGKTTLLRYFKDSMPKSDLIEPGMEAIAIRLSKSPYEGRIIEAVLRAIRYPFPKVSDTTVALKRTLSIEAIEQKGTRLVAVDEAHNLCRGNHSARRDAGEGSGATTYLSEMMDMAKVSLCLLGGPSLAQLEERDIYLASRCPTHIQLSNYKLEGPWLGFVQTFVKRCSTFDLGFLDAPEQRKPLFQAVSGNKRALKRLLIEAVLVAVDAKQRCLDAGCLAIAFQRVHGNTAPGSNPWGG